MNMKAWGNERISPVFALRTKIGHSDLYFIDFVFLVIPSGITILE